jgi:UDP-3-O-[3-hydroxymyristoyl] N-acetylglucosamine deacetylase
MGNMRKHRYPAGGRGKIKTVAQRTLKQPINCSGIALHSGLDVKMTIRPSEVDSGIVFRRTDITGGGALIPARWDQVTDTRMCSTLGNPEGVTIATVEHMMAALAGLEIDNAVIEVNGPEVPIMDGSAAPFVFLIECAGVVAQDRPRRVIRVLKPIAVDDGDRYASLAPGNGFSVSFDIDFDSAAVSRQRISVELGNGAFKRDLARARTFGFLHEVEELRASGLARGGSLDNAVVISGDKVLNEGGLRYDDEFVRHKALDAVGDLYLAGAPLRGHFYGQRSGHGTNNALLRALFADAEAWCYDELRSDEIEASVGLDIWTGDRAPTGAIPATA